MRFALAVFGVFVGAASAPAGIYNSTDNEFEFRYSQDILEFYTNTLPRVRSIGLDKVDIDNPLRRRYFLMEALGGATPAATLTLGQKLNYSAVLIRRKKTQQAIEFLLPLTRQHPEIFLFDAHLAMAYWNSGQPGNDRRAVELQSQLLSKSGWPERYSDLSEPQQAFFKQSMGWFGGEFELYRRYEAYLLKLMKGRLTENSGGKIEGVDSIFDDKKAGITVQFLNSDGKFEPGNVSSVEMKKLPGDAIDIVEQLSLWLPEDVRLYWLLGELANASWTPARLADAKVGKVALKYLESSDRIFNDLAYDYQIRTNDLRERRQMVRDALESARAAQPTVIEFDDEVTKKLDDEKRGVPMNTRTILITFVTGLAVGVFAIWQFQELRRRRRG